MTRADKRKYHYIYKTTCSVTNKFYIGMHSTDNLQDGYVGSGTYLWRSINKYGKENHSTEIIEHLSSREDLKLREAQIVNEELLCDMLCMNLKLGGEGRWAKDVGARGNITQIMLKETDPTWALNKSKAVSKAVMSNTDAIAKSKERLSDRHAKGLVDCATYGMLGKEHTTESKKQMSESHSAENNSQFGTCWIFSDEQNKSIKIDRNELNHWISKGWKPGRKIKNQQPDSGT